MSEFMLQQTQSSRIAAAYPGFISRFPTPESMARAPVADVLRAWAGLGYNRRAVQLHAAARACAARGGVPGTVDDLQELPGVGPYTARAVASFAFGADAACVDANVRRILTRLAALPPHAAVQPLADRLLPRGRSAAWNQAMMELGSAVCRPRAPRCESCPLRMWCAWAAGRRIAPPRRRPAPPFERTSRYARGRIVAALRQAADGLTRSSLQRRTGLASDRISAALEGLERDGVVHRSGRRIMLGQRERSRSLERSETT